MANHINSFLLVVLLSFIIQCLSPSLFFILPLLLFLFLSLCSFFSLILFPFSSA